MTTNKLIRIQTVVELLLMSVTYLALGAGIYRGVLGKPDEIIWHSAVILIPVLIAYFLRRKLRHFFVFVAIHVAMMFAAIIVGQNDLDSTFYFIAVLAVCVHSISLKMHFIDKSLYKSNPTSAISDKSYERAQMMASLTATERMSPYYAIVMVVFYVFGGYRGSVLLQNVEVCLFVLFVILQVAYNQLQNINKVFHTNQDKSEFPANQIFRINLIITSLIVLLMVIGMLLFYYGPYGNIFTIAGSALYAVFRLLLKIILTIWGSGPEQATPPVEEETTTQVESITDEWVTEAYEASAFMQALFETIGIVLLAALIGIVVYMAVRYAKKAVSAGNEGLDEIEFLNEETRKETFKEKVKTEKHKEYSSNAAYRKLYKKRVIQGNQKKKPDETLPPQILTKNTITSQDEYAKKVTDDYEKARYSKESVSKEEIDYLKNLKKQNLKKH